MQVAPPCLEVTQPIALKLEEIAREQAQGPPPMKQRSLNQIFYPPRSTNPCCFQESTLGGDVQFAFSPQYTAMLPKFTGNGDAYLFPNEFQEVCSMMRFPNLP